MPLILDLNQEQEEKQQVKYTGVKLVYHAYSYEVQNQEWLEANS